MTKFSKENMMAEVAAKYREFRTQYGNGSPTRRVVSFDIEAHRLRPGRSTIAVVQERDKPPIVLDLATLEERVQEYFKSGNWRIRHRTRKSKGWRKHVRTMKARSKTTG